MPFNSLGFLFFLGVLVLLWYVLPNKLRPYLILAASLLFYGIYSIKALIILLVYIGIVYAEGRLLGKKKTKPVLALCIVVGTLPLFVFKYLNFSISIADKVLNVLKISGSSHSVSLILPLGISYFTFKSLSYLIDIYKERIEPEKNVLFFAAFVSFFPEMLVGPIDRADNLLVQIKENRGADWYGFEKGVLIIAGGFFQKMVVADRIGLYVDTVYSNLYATEGLIVVLAACLYSLQIYFDFAGCTNMVIGMGKMMGFELPENFRQPYLGVSVADFWRRWHISLTRWLRDYIYIPLGGNRKGTVRKYINVMIVFLISGLWHGAGFNFIIWGGLNGLFQVIGTILEGTKNRIYGFFKISTDSGIVKQFKRLGTFILMTICWTFFRAESMAHAKLIFEQMFKSFNPWVFFDGTILDMGLSEKNLHLLILLLVIMLIYALITEAGVSVTDWVLKRHFVTKCVVFYIVFFAIIILGIYGNAQDWGNFIYVQF